MTTEGAVIETLIVQSSLIMSWMVEALLDNVLYDVLQCTTEGKT